MFDVAVLGLGAMGAMTAWRAAERGGRVVGSSGSSHGGSRIFRETLFEGIDYIPIIERSKPLWRGLEARSGTTLFRRSGGLYIGPRDGELVRDAQLAAAVGGFEQHLLEPDELASRYPQHATIDDDVAVFEPGAGVLDPEASIRAALDLAGAAGALLRFDTEVTGLHAGDGGVRIEVGDETIRANRAVVATGAWFTDLVGDLDLPTRFFDVDAGVVRIGGVDVRELGTEAVMSQVSLVFQDVYLFDATIAENVRLGRPDATDEELLHAARLARMDEIVDRLPDGWDTRVGERGAALSGGERQRVSIARAILEDAPIVLLDEATAALDPENEAAVQDALGALTADRTLLVIARRLQTIAAADQIAFLDGGRIVELGSHAQLLEQGGRYAAFWRGRSRAQGWRLAATVAAR